MRGVKAILILGNIIALCVLYIYVSGNENTIRNYDSTLYTILLYCVTILGIVLVFTTRDFNKRNHSNYRFIFISTSTAFLLSGLALSVARDFAFKYILIAFVLLVLYGLIWALFGKLVRKMN